ncbi:MAG: HYR domain-containing protein [Saprospiraceae bacterium]|nr:HYR domain-containing protein [Saprospiraceae bacterium]
MKFKSLSVLLLTSVLTISAATISMLSKYTATTVSKQNAGSHSKNSNVLVPESINCPGPIVLTADVNCMAEVIVQTPVSTCGNITFMSYTLPNGGGTVVLSSPYPTSINLGLWAYGIYELAWTVNDNCPPLPTSATCLQLIVIDDEEPVISCPDDISVGNSEDGRRSGNRMMFTPVTVGQPTATDNCTPDADITFTHDSPYSTDPNDASGDYPLGTTVVCWTATDMSGNTDSCCMNITVFDNTPPAISCPDTLTVPCVAPSPFQYYAQFLTAGGSATDETELDTSSFMFVIDSISNMTCPNKKTIKRFYKIGDTSGNMDTCFQVIIVNDNIAPTALCKDITVNLEPNGMVTIDAEELDNGSTDNCGGALTFSTNGNLFFGCNDVAAGGKVNVVLIVTDECGNSATCTSVVMVMDVTPPTVICPSDVTVTTTNNVCYATNVSLGTASTSDNCLPMNPAIPTLGGVTVTSNTQFPVGTNTVIWTVTDGGGNTATCSQTVVVNDGQNPTISCPSTVTVNTNAGVCYATNVNPGTPTTSDNCGVQSTVSTLSGNAISNTTQFPEGNTIIIWTVTDLTGNTATCSQIITVNDNQNPSITCPSGITVSANNNQCYATNVSLGTPASTSDNCGVQSTVATFGGSAVTSSTQFPVGTNVGTWTVTDINGLTATCTQTVIIRDTQNPSITCPSNQEAGLNQNCALLVPDFTGLVIKSDNCSNTTITQSPVPGTVISSSHNQTHTFTFTVTDNSGNTATCSITVTAKDRLGPDIVCRQPRIISISDEPELPASSFITSATDNCGGTLTYSARRMGNICGGVVPDDFGNYVNFCCDDVNDTITIIVRVTDARGNFTDCMTSVIVRDNLPPAIIMPLPDVSVSCEYALNLNNLSAFGTFVASGSTRQNIVINDPNSFYPPSGIAGQDGVYNDNCPGSTVSVSVRNMLTMCQTGQIKRDFVVTDGSGNTATYTQTIYVIDVDKFDASDITWPALNVNFNDCNVSNPPTSITGAPVINNDKCSQAAATYTDMTFAHPTHCKYIRRTWTVLDWCQYQTNVPNSPGKWTFIQNIYVVNTVPPTIGNKVCRDTIICTGNGCDANVTFNATGTDDCLPVQITWSYKIDINDNGGTPEYTGTGATVTRTYPMGTHRLTWEAKDGCSNISTCSFKFTVKDCKAPAAVAMQGLAINLTAPMAMAEIWASDFNNLSSDNCTPANQLKFSFSQNVNDRNRIFNCDSLGQRRIEFWVTDLAGNQSKTITFITVQDNHNLCGNNGRILISGKVYTEEGAKLSEAKIQLDGGETEGSFMTDNEGGFNFGNLAMFNDYQLLPEKNDNHLDGISTLDLVLIQRHILGIKALESPYKLIAADANNSKSISAADIVELRKLILGLSSKLSNNTSWRFVDATFKFNEPASPWPFAESLKYESLESNMLASDFIAVKVGDVNGTVSENITGKTSSRNNDQTALWIKDEMLNAGTLVNIPVMIESAETLVGLQWTFELGAGLHYHGIEADGLRLKNDNFAEVTRNGKRYVTISYDDLAGFKLDENKAMFNLILNADKSTMLSNVLTLSNTVTPSYAFNADMSQSDLRLDFRSGTSELASSVSQNQPNPFKDETNINVFKKIEGLTNISIYDAKGSAVYNQSVFMSAGLNSININQSHLGGRLGVFFVKIKDNDLNEVIKILRLE